MARTPGRQRIHLVRFETPVKVSDGGGGFSTSWVEHVTVYGDIERQRSFRSDMETLNSGGLNATPVVRVHVLSTVKTRAITGEMRVVEVATGRTMNVSHVQDIGGLNRLLVVTCREGKPV